MSDSIKFKNGKPKIKAGSPLPSFVLPFADSRSSPYNKFFFDSKGFTLVELNISIAVLGVLAVSLLGVLTNYFVILTRDSVQVSMTADSQNLLRSMVEQIRYGSGVRGSNEINDPNGPSGGWSTSNANFVIIIAEPAQNSTGNYITDINTGYPYMNEYVYFKQGSDLYRRTLAHPDASGNIEKTSCPANLASASCPADTKLIDSLNSMVFTLYDQDNNIISDPALARSVKIDLGLEKDSFGSPLSFDNSIRITLRNNFK